MGKTVWDIISDKTSQLLGDKMCQTSGNIIERMVRKNKYFRDYVCRPISRMVGQEVLSEDRVAEYGSNVLKFAFHACASTGRVIMFYKPPEEIQETSEINRRFAEMEKRISDLEKRLNSGYEKENSRTQGFVGNKQNPAKAEPRDLQPDAELNHLTTVFRIYDKCKHTQLMEISEFGEREDRCENRGIAEN